MKQLKFMAFAAVMASPAMASGEEVDLILNWVPTADHSPYFYAREQGWYKDAGIELDIESGRGSGAAAQRVGAGISQIGVADTATALVAKSKGADFVAVMAVYANSPQGFYWLKSNGIRGPEDFAGRKIGNPPADASRVMWPMFAQTVGIDADSVTFVNVSPQAKLPSLKSGAIDVTSDFYNEHDAKMREFGDDLGFVAWRNIGINPYGNSVIVNAEYLASNRERVEAFTKITQRAFKACVEDFEPCLEALVKNVSGLDKENQRDQWRRIKELMRDPTTQEVALGAYSAERMSDDYRMVETYFGMDTPFSITDVYTNAFLDPAVKMTK